MLRSTSVVRRSHFSEIRRKLFSDEEFKVVILVTACDTVFVGLEVMHGCCSCSLLVPPTNNTWATHHPPDKSPDDSDKDTKIDRGKRRIAYTYAGIHIKAKIVKILSCHFVCKAWKYVPGLIICATVLL